MSDQFGQPLSFDQQQQGHQLQDQPPNKTHPLANYQFTAEEMAALKECDYESFIRRSIPLGTTFGLGAYFAVANGYLKPSIKWGSGPKVLLGVIVGYFVGKFSYQKQCAEKIMALPNSKLGEMLRHRRKGGIIETLSPDQGFGSGLALGPFASQSDQYSDVFSKSNSLNLDTERPAQSGLDDNQRPNVDSNAIFEDDLPLEPPKVQTSYDELRQRNRDEYAKKQQNPYYRPIQEAHQPIVRPPATRPDADEPVQSKGPKNKYGDTWSQ